MDINIPGEQESVVEDFIKNGMLLFEMGLYYELTQLCHELLAEIPDDRVYSMLSSAEFALDDYKAAEKSARSGLSINPENPDLLYNLACILENKGLLSNALRYYVRAKEASDNAGDNESDNESDKEGNKDGDNADDKAAVDELSIICNAEISKLEDMLGKNVNELIPKKAQKRVLVIAAIYPPASGSGVQRTVKLVKYLRFFGWEPVVVAPLLHEKLYLSGNDFFDELPDDIEVIRTPFDSIASPSIIEFMKDKLVSMLSDEIREEFLSYYEAFNYNQRFLLCSFPEPVVLWAYLISDSIEKYVDMDKIDLIYSTSGPYSDHFLAFHIKQQYDKPWVVDFRDEWSMNPYIWPNKNDIFYKICVDCEQTFFDTCDHLICVTEHSYENYLNLGLAEEKLSCITNGYDEEDFESIFNSSACNERFTIVHNGILYIDRDPFTLLSALKNLIDRKEIDADKIVFHMGHHASAKETEDLEALVKQIGLDNIASCTPHMEHHDSVCHAASADLLLVLLGASAKYTDMYPAKVFEYLRLRKPILCLGPGGSIMEDLLIRTGHGTNVGFTDIEGIERELLRHYNAWLEKGTLSVTSHSDITIYERKNLTRRHAEVFDKVGRD